MHLRNLVHSTIGIIYTCTYYCQHVIFDHRLTFNPWHRWRITANDKISANAQTTIFFSCKIVDQIIINKLTISSQSLNFDRERRLQQKCKTYRCAQVKIFLAIQRTWNIGFTTGNADFAWKKLSALQISLWSSRFVLADVSVLSNKLETDKF